MSKYLNKISPLFLCLLVGFGLIACMDLVAGNDQVDQNEHNNGEADPVTTVNSQIGQAVVEGSAAPTQIIGNVIDSRTGAALQAKVYLNEDQVSLEPTKSMMTDDHGYFQVQGVDLPFMIRVEAPGYELWEARFDPAELFAVRATHYLKVRLDPRITTAVVRAADTGKRQARVKLTVYVNNHRQTIVTDALGTFELYSLLPNDRITVQSSEEYLPIEVRFSGEHKLTFELLPRDVSITVNDAFTGNPVAGALVTFNQTLTGTTSSQGPVTFSLIPPSGQISVTSSGYSTATVDYQGEESVETEIFPLGLQGVVRGSDTGQPLPQATIYLDDTFFRTDDNGHFVLETLPITPARLMIKAAGYQRAYAQLAQTGVITSSTPPFSGVKGRWLTSAPCTDVPQPDIPLCLDIIMEPFQAKAIYVPQHYLGSRELMIDYLDFIATTELNAIVVDVKGDFGFIAWDSNVDLVTEVGADEWFTGTGMPLDEFVAEAKARNIYTIARFVVFKDNPLAYAKPEWAAVREDGTVWIDREELGWANPFREEVRQYNINLAKEVAAFGVDELNFDYIRFPSDGDVDAIVYEEENTLETRTAAIRQLLMGLSEALQPYAVFTSADVFGLTVWVPPTNDMNIGQRVVDIVPYVDYLAPMIYPSTFITGNLGYDDPSADPYGVVYRSQKEAEALVPPYVKVRPWLQGYWYSLEEMQLLKQAAIDSGSTGWSWWNAGGKYDDELFEPAQEQ